MTENISILPLRIFRLFLNVFKAELGSEVAEMILLKAELPADLLTDPQLASHYTSQTAADAFSRIQQAMRVYYGRGARGTLTRTGRLIWQKLLESTSISEKAQAQMVRAFPVSMRVKPTLELVARWMREQPEGVTIHTLDTDLMLVDHASPTASGQKDDHPICFVTGGLIQEVLFWATGREHDVEEVSCKATGGDDCEFRIYINR